MIDTFYNTQRIVLIYLLLNVQYISVQVKGAIWSDLLTNIGLKMAMNAFTKLIRKNLALTFSPCDGKERPNVHHL